MSPLDGENCVKLVLSYRSEQVYSIRFFFFLLPIQTGNIIEINLLLTIKVFSTTTTQKFEKWTYLIL